MRNDEISEDGRNENDKGTKNRAYCDLYDAAVEGDWGKAKEIYKVYPDYVRDKLSEVGDTALHVAVVAGSNDFVIKLVSSKYMQPGDLEIRNDEGDTAFILAAMLGNIKVVLMMLERNKDLVIIRNRGGMLPVQMAASLVHEKMVKYLYNLTRGLTLTMKIAFYCSSHSSTTIFTVSINHFYSSIM